MYGAGFFPGFFRNRLVASLIDSKMEEDMNHSSIYNLTLPNLGDLIHSQPGGGGGAGCYPLCNFTSVYPT